MESIVAVSRCYLKSMLTMLESHGLHFPPECMQACTCNFRGTPRLRQKQLKISLVCDVDKALDRLLPGMECQIEQTPMDWQQQFPLQFNVSLSRLDWAHVDVRPVGVIGPNLQHGQVEWAEGIADLAEAGEKSRIRSKE